MARCEVCNQDIFPRVSTRLMGARCLEHSVAPRSVALHYDPQSIEQAVERAEMLEALRDYIERTAALLATQPTAKVSLDVALPWKRADDRARAIIEKAEGRGSK